MSQDNILKTLEKAKKPLDINQITKRTGLSRSTAGHTLKILRQREEVSFNVIYDKTIKYIYWKKGRKV